jgi:hypothetical protein
VQCVLESGSEQAHGIGIATTGASLVMDVLPPGELTIYCGTPALAQQVLELMSHLKPDA